MKILVLNAGSSSVKFKLYDMEAQQVLADGNCQRVGLANSEIKYVVAEQKKWSFVADLASHHQALSRILELLTQGETQVLDSIGAIDAVGHRISMGGSKYQDSVLVDEDVLQTVEGLADIAPLHNPPQAQTVRDCQKLFGRQVPMVAGFDTAFHQTIPQVSYLFPVPYRYYEQYGLRRFGFHGLSHQFVVERYAQLTGKDLGALNLVTCHLGGGSSLTAVKGGKSVDNTFGLGTGEGVICGTRAGSFDHVALGYLLEKENLTFAQAEDMLHRESGLLGISGSSSDEKELEERAAQGDARAQLALDVLVHQVTHHRGAYAFEMGGLDGVIFTGGIGENSHYIRQRVCEGLRPFGIYLDPQANREHNRQEHRISAADSPVDLYIIPTNEEWMIARDTQRIVSGLAK